MSSDRELVVATPAAIDVIDAEPVDVWLADDAHPVALWLANRTRLRTQSAYAYEIAEFARWLRDERGKLDVLDADFADALRYREALSNTTLATSTILKKLYALSGLYSFLADLPQCERVARNPFAALDMPTASDVRVKRAWTPDEKGAFFAAIPRDGSLLHVRDRALFKVLFGNGPRIGEVTGANVGDLTLESGYHVLVLREHSRDDQHLKTGSRKLVFKATTAEPLLEYLRARGIGDGGVAETAGDWRNLPLFAATRLSGRPTRDGRNRSERGGDTRLSDRNVRSRMQVYGKIAGIDPDLCHPHIARHTVISELLALNIDIVAVMDVSGHKSLASVQRYAHARQQVVHNAALRLPG